jgi:hypothetical protein
MTKEELGSEIAWAGGWQEYHQRRKEWVMYDYWTERYNTLRREYDTEGLDSAGVGQGFLQWL